MLKILDFLIVRKYSYELFLHPFIFSKKIAILFNKYIRNFFRRNSLHSCEIGLTYHCQLECLHCGVFGQKKPACAELSDEKLIEFIDDLRLQGVTFVVFGGGEPLLHKSLVRLVAHCTKNNIITAISTNGLLLHDEMIDNLKYAGISFLNVSLDSSHPEKHDESRKRKGCFEAVAKNISKCVEKGVFVVISTVATKENIKNGDLENLIKYSKSIGAYGVRILFAVPSGRRLGCRERIFTEEEREKVRTMLDPVFVYVEGMRNAFTECPAVARKLIYLSPYGDIQPCSFVPVSFGNINRKSFADIYKYMSAHSFFKFYSGGDCIMRQKEFHDRYFCLIDKSPDALPIEI